MWLLAWPQQGEGYDWQRHAGISGQTKGDGKDRKARFASFVCQIATSPNGIIEGTALAYTALARRTTALLLLLLLSSLLYKRLFRTTRGGRRAGLGLYPRSNRTYEHVFHTATTYLPFI